MKKLVKAILLSLVVILLICMPVLAAVAYRAAYTIIESDGNAYDMLAVLELADNEWMADNGFMQLDALDTRIETLGGLIKPHMVATNKTLTAVPVVANSQTNLYFTTANSDLSSMDIITGYDGYITIDDDATLELGSDFEIEQSGYIDTSDSNFTYLDKKRGAYSNPITDTDEISGVIYFDDPIDVSPGAGDVGGWTDIDISAYVPAYATGAVVHLSTTAVIEVIGVRINGSALDMRGNVYGLIWAMVGIDDDDIFEGWIQSVNDYIYLVGFTGSGVTYQTVPDNISLGAFPAWTNIDLSVEAPDAIGVIVAVDNTVAGAGAYGLRKNGSADARTDNIVGDGWYYGIVGCDGSQVIQGSIGALTTDFYLVGYITADFTFNTNGTDKSLAAGFGVWSDIDCSSDVTGFTTHIIFEVVAAVKDYGFRRNGSAENIHPEHQSHCWVVVECDEDQVVQMWAEDNTVDCYIIGYTEGYIDNAYEKVVTATNITSGEYTVKTYGVVNESAWATGDVLHFTGAADSNVNATAINDNIAKLWVSLWFRLDSTFSAASTTDQFIWGKFNGAADYVYAYLESDDGILYFKFDDGVNPFTLTSTTVSWTGNAWYHIITSLSDDPAQRLLVNNTAEDTDIIAASNTPNGGDFIFGDFDDPGAVTGFIGEIQNVIIGIDNLTTDEETALYAGTAPGDETDYWYADEGVGTVITSYGSAANVGTADTACTWETSTYTTGSTGRLCDFYIEVDDGVTDPDRWGANLKGASVPPNGNNWTLNQNNVMPYMDYYKHTVGGVEHAWYQPNYMVEATDYDGTETAGGSAVTVTDNTMGDAPGYWVNALVTITDTGVGHAAPEGEARVCTVFAAGGVITVAPAFSDNVDVGDDFTIDFGTLIDRSHYGLEFDGIDSRVTVPDDASLRLGTADCSILAWVKLADTPIDSFPVIVAKGTTGAGEWMFRATGASFLANLRGAGGAPNLNGTIALADDVWRLLSFVRDGDNGYIYVNDALDVTNAGWATSDFNTALDLTISSVQLNGRVWTGIIDEVLIYTRALDLAEVAYNYNSGVGTYTPYSTVDLVGWWHMEEGSGNTIADTSGEGNTGTLQANTAWANGKVPRPPGSAGTNDDRITWGGNPTGVVVEIGGMVSIGQPTPGDIPLAPAQDILPETPVSDWFGDHTVSGALLTNPLRPFVTMLSDNSTLSEIQSWRLYALALILLVTVATAVSVGRHQGITAIAAGAAILGVVVLTIFPMWALVFAIGMFIGGLVMERSPSL